MKKIRQSKYFITYMVGLIVFSILSMFIFSRVQYLKKEEIRRVTSDYSMLQHEFDHFVSDTSSIIKAFSAYIETFDVYQDDIVYSLLHQMLKDYKETIRVVSVTEGTEIKWVFPEKDKDAVIHNNRLTTTEQTKEVEYIVNYLKPTFTGPVDIIQGYEGYIIRIPIQKSEQYWGMISVVLDSKTTFDFIDEFQTKYNTCYLVSSIREEEKFLYGEEDIKELSPLVFNNKSVIGEWRIYTAPDGGWNHYTIRVLIYLFMSLLVSLIMMKLIYKQLNKYEKIKAENIVHLNNSIKDSLTKLFNRSYFDSVVNSEISKADRHHIPMAMIYFDLDYFKQINDVYGHSIGDQVLISVAKTVETVVRKGDIFSRWGGDEFAVLLPFTDLEGAKNVAEKIRKKVSDIKFSEDIHMTISLGVSERVQNEYYGSWFKRTDDALYKSKVSGRDTLTVAECQHEVLDLKIPWMNTWECGNKTIDRQHKELVRQCNKLIEEYTNQGKNNDELISQISSLINGIEKHFHDEIKILKQTKFSLIEEHENLHNELLIVSKELGDKIINKEIDVHELFYFLLNEVIIGHMREEDIKYYRFL